MLLNNCFFLFICLSLNASSYSEVSGTEEEKTQIIYYSESSNKWKYPKAEVIFTQTSISNVALSILLNCKGNIDQVQEDCH